MPRLGIFLVAAAASSLGGRSAQRGAHGFTMMASTLRRVGSSSAHTAAGAVGAFTAAGARRGVLAFLGGAGSTGGAPRSRWATTMSAAAAQSSPSLSVHKKESAAHPAYDVLEEDFVAEYGATTTLYKHKKSGAEVLSVQIDDDNKVIHVGNSIGN